MTLNDDFDNKLFTYFKENRQVPKKITDSISKVELSRNKNTKNIIDTFSFKKIAVAAVSLITISTGVVFANDISHFVKNLFNDSKSVTTAIGNDYVYQAPTVYSVSSNTETRITEMLMDDYTLDINMIATFDSNIDVTGIDKLKIPDMIIYDNCNNILYSSSTETSKSFCESKGIGTDYNTIKNITTNTSSSIFIYNADTNTISFTCNLSASDEKFPISQKIYVSFNTIEMEGNNKNYKIIGNWNNELIVPSKFINRTSTIYRIVSCNNDNVYKDSIKAEVYETGMNFQMTMYWGDYTIWHNKMEEIRKKNALASQLIIQEKSYVENEKGEKFYPIQSSSSDGGYSFNTDGKLVKWESFGLTKFNMTEKLKVVLTTINDDQIIIELEK